MSAPASAERKQLRNLARLYGVRPSHYDVSGRLNPSPPQALIAALRMLGAPVEKIADLGGAVRARRQDICRATIDPVIVLWHGQPGYFKLRVPSPLAQAAVHCAVELENGATLTDVLRDDASWQRAERVVEGAGYVTRRMQFSAAPPLGCRRMRVEIGGHCTEHYLFVAPMRAYGGRQAEGKSWGLFCPPYALHSATSWGTGDFSDLRALGDFTGRLGGAAVGTLPLFAAFLAEPFNPSPYAPVSRLFWNELFLAIDEIPELKRCIGARSIVDSAVFAAELESLRAAPLVDYRRAMALKREVLNELLRCLLRQPSPRREEFEGYVAANPRAQDYAAFRAKTEGERKPWRQWSGPSRDGHPRPGDCLDHIKHNHLFVQWLAEQQVNTLSAENRADAPVLYRDFPLGVNRDGCDVWREREVFALGASGGAPPDGFFVKGQDWGFPPLHPEGLRRQGYRYYIECVRHHLRHAVASLNTHDTPTFAGFWSGADIADRVDLGLLAEAQADNERQGRERQRAALIAYFQSLGLLDDGDTSAAAVLRAWLLHLAAGDAEFVLVDLEDLWLEPAPQNVPGTWQERPNWQRKARYTLEQFHEFGAMRETLLALDQARQKGSDNDL